MGEIDQSTAGDSQTSRWTALITLDAPGSPTHGKPLNPLTNTNTFDDFDAAVQRAVDVRNNPHDEVDYSFDDGQSVSVKVTQSLA
jgi:hypothetical protein